MLCRAGRQAGRQTLDLLELQHRVNWATTLCSGRPMRRDHYQQGWGILLQCFLLTKMDCLWCKSVLSPGSALVCITCPHPTTSPLLSWSTQCTHILGCVCKYFLTVPFFGGGLESRAGLSLTECQSSWFPALLSCPSQQVRKTCLQWKPRNWWASQRCPSWRSCSPREQQSQHSCRSHSQSLHM